MSGAIGGISAERAFASVFNNRTASAVSDLQGSVAALSAQTLWIGSRIAAVLVFLLVLGVVAAAFMYYNEYRKTLPPSRRSSGFRPYKFCHQVKLCLYDCLCCAFCCTSAQAMVAPEYMRPTAPLTLRVTLLRADRILKRRSFYLEVSTDPSDAWPKTSRVQHKAVGSCDLGAEALDLDWYGDEEAVVIYAVQYSGSQVSNDRAFAEVRLSRESVQRYAAEAAEGGDELGAGSRLFTAREISPQSVRIRNARFKGPSPIQPMLQPFLPGIIAALQDQQGAGADHEDPARLKEEVQRLRAENEALGGTLYRAGPGGAFATKGDDGSAEAVMRLALRFEILGSQRCYARTQLFKTHTFDEETEAAPRSTWC